MRLLLDFTTYTDDLDEALEELGEFTPKQHLSQQEVFEQQIQIPADR